MDEKVAIWKFVTGDIDWHLYGGWFIGRPVILKDGDDEWRVWPVAHVFNKYESEMRDKGNILQAANKSWGGHGVESFVMISPIDWKFARGEYEFMYVNMGDTYGETLVYDPITDTIYTSSWGDVYEKYQAEGLFGEGQVPEYAILEGEAKIRITCPNCLETDDYHIHEGRDFTCECGHWFRLEAFVDDYEIESLARYRKGMSAMTWEEFRTTAENSDYEPLLQLNSGIEVKTYGMMGLTLSIAADSLADFIKAIHEDGLPDEFNLERVLDGDPDTHRHHDGFKEMRDE